MRNGFIFGYYRRPVKVLGLASAFGTSPLGALIGGFPAGGALGMSSAKVGRNAKCRKGGT